MPADIGCDPADMPSFNIGNFRRPRAGSNYRSSSFPARATTSLLAAADAASKKKTETSIALNEDAGHNPEHVIKVLCCMQSFLLLHVVPTHLSLSAPVRSTVPEAAPRAPCVLDGGFCSCIVSSQLSKQSLGILFLRYSRQCIWLFRRGLRPTLAG